MIDPKHADEGELGEFSEKRLERKKVQADKNYVAVKMTMREYDLITVQLAQTAQRFREEAKDLIDSLESVSGEYQLARF